MVIYLIRVVEKLLIIYFTLYFIIDIGLFIYSLAVFRRKNRQEVVGNNTDYTNEMVSIIVPAYNEDVSIVHCTQLLLELDYPSYEIILVNDGSRDRTLDVVKNNFEFNEIEAKNECLLVTKPIMNVYRSATGRLILIDKQNGGKADSINAGINYSTGKYICTIDADSILDANALKHVVNPFLNYPHTIVSGGQLAAANDVTLVHNKVVSSKHPKNIWVQWQIIEYIKSFMISRIGLSRINALLIMSGAFSMYKKVDLIRTGGFLTAHNTHPYIEKTIGLGKQTVCEDMEIVVRLWQYSRDRKVKARAVFLPEPVCWTEVPDNGKNLFKQRSRWHQGLAETLKIHDRMIFEPAYGVTGMIGLPYYFLFELLSPAIKLFTLFFIVLSAYYGLVNYKWAMLLLASVMLTTAIILSSITAIIENWSQKQHAVNRDALRYKSYFDWVWLIGAGILAEFSYSFYKIAAQIDGMINFFRGKNNWNKFARKGVQKL
jgi:cellulose synthase/poly-beta-1,6-N-acetylglucosamine synthase-like glycosyltransferase